MVEAAGRKGSSSIRSESRSIVSLILIGMSMFAIPASAMAEAENGTDAGLLYVCNEGSGDISIVDLRTNTAIDRIERPSIPHGIVLSPDGSRLYVAGEYSNSISVIDTGSDGLIDTVKIDSGLNFSPNIAISPDGQSLCVMGEYGHGIKVVNASTLNVTARSTTGVKPRGAVFSPDSRTLYVADMGDNSIRALDTGTGKITGSLSFLGYPIGVSVSPDGKHIYGAVISKASYDRLYPTDCPTCTCTPIFILRSIVGLISGKGASIMNDTDAVYILDAHDLSVESVIPLEAAPMAFAAGPDGLVYVACDGPYSSYLYVIDATTKTVTDRILIGSNINTRYVFTPVLIAASPDGSRVYLGGGATNSALYMVNMTGHNVTKVDLGGGYPVSISAGVSKAYVSIGRGNKVLAIDPGNGTIANTLSYWWDPQNIVLSPDGSRAYVTSEIGNLVTVIDTRENRIALDIPLSGRPGALAINPGGSMLYIADFDNDSVSMINTQNGMIAGTVPVGHMPDGLAFSPDGALLYVTNQEPAMMAIEPQTGSVLSVDGPKNDSLYAIDTKTGRVSWTMDVRYMPAGIAVSPDGGRLYITCRKGTSERIGDVWVIDARNRSLVKSIEVRKEPEGIRISPDGSRLYVVHFLSNKVTVIDTGTNAVVATIDLEDPMPKYMAIGEDGSRLYVSSGGFVTGGIEVVDTTNNTVCCTIETGFSPAGMAVKSPA